ncbi:hypothetical protein AVEN_51773-1 [Araneus ventricosus]|uniref:Uncharacterized protein n=1 Tax=Araneus ventricosus TaxID=182803 RepID=A0A4Y2WX28_ARAVE|nr:hypothetical protein AVEN_51773-1 [Araneus ventricosus]
MKLAPIRGGAFLEIFLLFVRGAVIGGNKRFQHRVRTSSRDGALSSAYVLSKVFIGSEIRGRKFERRDWEHFAVMCFAYSVEIADKLFDSRCEGGFFLFTLRPFPPSYSLDPRSNE